jgi:hypothetical protein
MPFDTDYILSDSDVNGHFSFTNYCIYLHEDDLDFLNKIQQHSDLREYNEALRKFSTIMHEFRHYIDMTHTVYGVSYLHDLNYSLQLKYGSSNGDEFNYFKIKEFVDKQKTIRYPKYYHLLFENENLKKWKLIPSIGRTFDSSGKVSKKPVLFARYYNSADEPLARHPFSMVSLLECSASIEEYINSIIISKRTFKDVPEKLKYVEGSFSELTMKYIYDIRLTEYSTCFHLVANHFKYPELQDTFEIARILLDLCLNMTDDHFDKLESGQFIDSLYGPNPKFSINEQRDYIEFFENLRSGVKFKDRPILFYAIIQSFKPKQYNRDEFLLELDLILGKFGLSFEAVMKDAKMYIADKAHIISNSKIELFSLIGKSIVKNVSILKTETYSMSDERSSLAAELIQKLDFPSLNVNEQFFDLTKKKDNVFNGIDYKKLFNEVDFLNRWLNDFCDACV